MTNPVTRWTIPADGADHTFSFAGSVSGYINIANDNPALALKGLLVLEFWSWMYPSVDLKPAVQTRTLRVFNTGVDIPEGYILIGSVSTGSGVAYHLFEKPVPTIKMATKIG